MPKKLRSTAILFAIFFTCNLQAQITNPPAFTPNSESTMLVDSIIKITNYEAYFLQYCHDRVEDYAEANKWSQSKKENILRTISFKRFSSTFHNGFGSYTPVELKKLIEVLVPINQKLDSYSKVNISNFMISRNLDFHIDNIINGKYITNK